MVAVTDPQVDVIAKKLEAELKARSTLRPAFSVLPGHAQPSWFEMTIHEVVAFVLNGGEVLAANSWNPNRVHKAELKLLEFSLLSTGWIQPILISNEDIDEDGAQHAGWVIDGFHRWRLSQDSDKVKERYNYLVPCARLNVGRAEAMAITVRINRAKGTHVAINMAALVKELAHVHGWTIQRIGKEIGAGKDEVELLLRDGVFAAKGIQDWAYSNAWYPEKEQ